MYQNKIKEIDELQKEINQHRPLKKQELRELKEYYRIGLTYSSNALEGNSLTETETKIILEEGVTAAGKPLKDHYEVAGHSEAYDLLYKLTKKKEITEKDILNLHALFYFRIDSKQAGYYRKKHVLITGTKFIPPSPRKIPELMKKYIDKLSVLKKKCHPVEYAALLHKEFVSIHPFIDGNGRCARLLMNLALFQGGLVITIIPPVLRRDYIDALNKTHSPSNNDKPFIHFISCMVYESQKDYVRLLRSMNN